jgi:glycosyltransferase involved in cell wall biosynthesis
MIQPSLKCHSTNKKVLMIAYVFPPIAYVGTYRTLRFCRYLPENGWAPSVVTIKETSDLVNDQKLLHKLPNEIKIFRTSTIDFWRFWNRFKKNHFKTPKEILNEEYQNKSLTQSTSFGQRRNFINKIKIMLWEFLTIPDHMVFWLPFASIEGIKILSKNHTDLLYSTSPPHSSHIIGLILSRLFKKPWVADFRDPILDSSGYNPPTRIRLFVDQALERIIVNNADCVLIISNYYRQLIEKRYPALKHKFVTMPNSYDPEDFKDIQPDFFSKFTIIYSGSFYSNRTPQFFLEVFGSWFRAQTPEIQNNVQVIFYGMMSADTLKNIHQEGLESIIVTPGIIPKEKLIPKLKGADLLLLIIGFDPESRGTVTSKIYEYMACNRPILAIVPEGDAAEILKQYDQTYWMKSEDHDLLYENLNKAYFNYSSEKKTVNQDNISKNNGIYVYDAKYQTKRLADIFNKAL